MLDQNQTSEVLVVDQNQTSAAAAAPVATLKQMRMIVCNWNFVLEQKSFFFFWWTCTRLSISISISSGDGIIMVLPLGAVGVAGVTLVVGLGVLEDETVGALQAVGALLHAVGTVFEVAASHALVGALGKGERERERAGEREREREFSRGCVRSFRSCNLILSLHMFQSHNAAN